MKIEFDVPQADIGKSVAEILNSLNYDDRRSLAREVLREWLGKGMDGSERAKREKEVVDELRKEFSATSPASQWHVRSDKDIRETYAFRTKMGDWKSVHDAMLEQITQEVARHYREQVDQVVREDARVKACCHEVAEAVKRNLPKAVHDAMVAWFVENMRGILEGVAHANMNLSGFEEFKASIQERLGRMGQTF